MPSRSSQSIHAPTDELFAAHAAATLSNGKHLLLSCQAAIEPEMAKKLADFDVIGGAIIESARAEEMTNSFVDGLLAALDDVADDKDVVVANAHAPAWMPAALADYLREAEIELKWRNVGPGVQHAPITTAPTGERLYLLRAAPGTKMPVHSHAGEEWTLILQGGYHVGDVGYVRGDLHCEDEVCEHQPLIDDHGEACISLVVDQGPLKFRNWLLKVAQKFTGI